VSGCENGWGKLMNWEQESKSRQPDTRQLASSARSWARFAVIIAIYGLLGPFMGAVGINAFLVAAAVGSEIARGEYGEIPRLIFGGFAIGVMISLIIAYAMGAASALVVGVAVAIADRRQRGISLRVALVTALVSWSLAAALATTFIPGDALAAWIALLLLAHLLLSHAHGSPAGYSAQGEPVEPAQRRGFPPVWGVHCRRLAP